MKCPMENREGEELLLNYVSGSLDAQAAASFDRHMLTCSACREFAHGQKVVWESLDVFEPASISADFDRRLYQRMEEVSWWDRVVAQFRAPLFLHRGLPIAAAAAALVVAGIVWQHPSVISGRAQHPLSAEMQTLEPDQVQHALDDMDMLRDFNQVMRPEPAESKM